MSSAGLKQAITVRYAVALYVSSVLGAGILVIPGLAAQVAGPASLLAWGLLSVASYPFAYTFSRLSARRPESGGIYSFAKEALGQRAASAVAWLFVAMLLPGAPALSLAAGFYVSSAVPMSRPEVYALATAILLAAFAVNYRGIRFSGRVQLAVVVLIVGVLSFAVAASSGNVRAANFVPFVPEGAASVGVAAALIVWSYLGYENVSNVAEEFKDPRRDFGRSVAVSVVLVSVLYLASAFVVVGTGAYRSGGGVTPFSGLMSSVLGPAGVLVVAALAVFIVFGNMNAYVAGMARVVYAAAKDGGFPAGLSDVHRGSGVPRRSIGFLLAVTMAGLAAFYLLGLDIQSGFLATSGAAILIYVIGSAAGVRLLKEGGWRRALPWASLAVSVAILPFIGPALAVSLAVALFGLAYGWVAGFFRRRR